MRTVIKEYLLGLWVEYKSYSYCVALAVIAVGLALLGVKLP